MPAFSVWLIVFPWMIVSPCGRRGVVSPRLLNTSRPNEGVRLVSTFTPPNKLTRLPPMSTPALTSNPVLSGTALIAVAIFVATVVAESPVSSGTR